MQKLAIHLALHGAILLTASLVAGLILYRAICDQGRVAAWHLAHSGGSGRGTLLIALAAIFPWIALSRSKLVVFVWLVIFFAWTSTSAMVIAAISGERGLGWYGSNTNKAVYLLYLVGTVAVFPAAFLLVEGFLDAL